MSSSNQMLFQDKPVIIAGPCSAESEEQVLKTALELSNQGIRIFRAGLWKPRTRPGSFEGVGSQALPWLSKVKEKTGMQIATEVANIWHVRECSRFDVDILWIGARTTANPFAVQELADALKGFQGTVLIKNPVNPDINLWIGALERFQKAGVKNIGLIHRGFSSYGQSAFRNIPQWELPVELKRRMPEIPLLNDPSHICGRRDTLFPVMQKAMDLDFTGLFIESHIEPENALSDKNQQVTPAQLEVLLDQLILRGEFAGDEALEEKLEELRRQIDVCDQDLLQLFEQRMKIATAIGEVKRQSNLTILQTNRWASLLQKRITLAKKLGLNEEFVIRIFKSVHQESMNQQNRVMN